MGILDILFKRKSPEEDKEKGNANKDMNEAMMDASKKVETIDERMKNESQKIIGLGNKAMEIAKNSIQK